MTICMCGTLTHTSEVTCTHLVLCYGKLQGSVCVVEYVMNISCPTMTEFLVIPASKIWERWSVWIGTALPFQIGGYKIRFVFYHFLSVVWLFPVIPASVVYMYFHQVKGITTLKLVVSVPQFSQLWIVTFNFCAVKQFNHNNTAVKWWCMQR